MPLTGTLSTMPLTDLLQWLGSARASGTLSVEHAKIVKTFVFRDGLVTGCSSDDPPQRRGHFLVSRGKITEEQLRYALKLQESTGEHLGRILIGMGALSEKDVSEHLAAKAEETIFSIFDWDHASFHFEDDILDVANLMQVTIAVEDILLRGLKRYDETRMIREVISGPNQVLAHTEKEPPAEVMMSRMARRIYDAVDGHCTVREVVLRSHASEFLCNKLLYELHRGGFVETVGFRDDSATAEPVAAAADVDALPGPPPSTVDPPAAVAAPAAAEVAAPAAPELDFDAELANARKLLASDEFEPALEALDRLYRAKPQNESLRRLAREAETAFVDQAYRHFVPAERIPVLAVPDVELEQASLSPTEFYMVSRFDGNWDVRSIVRIIPMREVEALRTLKRLREQGIIELIEPPPD